MNQDKGFWVLPAIIVGASLLLVFVSFLFKGNDDTSKNKSPTGTNFYRTKEVKKFAAKTSSLAVDKGNV